MDRLHGIITGREEAEWSFWFLVTVFAPIDSYRTVCECVSIVKVGAMPQSRKKILPGSCFRQASTRLLDTEAKNHFVSQRSLVLVPKKRVNNVDDHL